MMGCDTQVAGWRMLDAQMLVAEAARHFEGDRHTAVLEHDPRGHDHEPVAAASGELTAA